MTTPTSPDSPSLGEKSRERARVYPVAGVIGSFDVPWDIEAVQR
jgi:hypothetical protein